VNEIRLYYKVRTSAVPRKGRWLALLRARLVNAEMSHRANGYPKNAIRRCCNAAEFYLRACPRVVEARALVIITGANYKRNAVRLLQSIKLHGEAGKKVERTPFIGTKGQVPYLDFIRMLPESILQILEQLRLKQLVHFSERSVSIGNYLQIKDGTRRWIYPFKVSVQVPRKGDETRHKRTVK
jgi:hypothetical protein